MTERVEKSKIAILSVLKETAGPIGATGIKERLSALGFYLQPRTIRHYLAKLDEEGLTRFVSRRKGREITERGREELAQANIIEKVGFVATRVDNLGYQMSFNLRDKIGTIITNVAILDETYLVRALEEMKLVFAQKLSMGSYIAVSRAGESIGGYRVPDGKVGMGVLCGVTVNGLLLSEGIPVMSRFGGLLAVRDGKLERFVELVEYRGTTIDPLEVFIRARMTGVRACVRQGFGLVGASFREIPAAAVEDIPSIDQAMRKLGLGGIVALGRPNQPLLGIPVGDGHAGMIVMGGLNPIAAIYEAGTRVSMQSLTGLEDFGRFRLFEQVRSGYR